MDRDQVLFRLFGRFCPQGTILLEEGAVATEAQYLLSGTVRLQRRAGAAVGTLAAGALLAEESFFGASSRPGRAEAATDARLVPFSDRTLDAVVRNGPEAGLAIAERFLALGTAARRDLESWTLAHALRRVGPHLAGDAPGSRRLAELAEQAGAAPADVARLLEELERLGAAVREAGDVWRFPDGAALERAARAVADAGEPR